MGRYVRPLLRKLATRSDIHLTLLVRDPRDVDDYRAIVGKDVEVMALASARTSDRYDCVWYPWNGIRFRARAPAVVTINDDFAFRFPARGIIARRREKGPVRRAVRKAEQIVTISTWSRDALVSRFALRPDRISILPLGPDPSFSAGSEPSPFGERFVLAVGTSDARKNAAFLIDVFARAFPERDVRLVLVGNFWRPLSASLERANVPIAFLTRVDDDALRRLYRTAAVVAIPSLAEGFGLVAAEASACGAAVIASDTTALPELIGSAGVLVDPQDRTGWCTALRELVRDEARNTRYRGLAATRWADWSAERTMDALLGAFKRAIDDR